MTTTRQLIQTVAVARKNYLDTISDFSEEQALWKPAPDSWNAVEVTEHLFWAEHGGIVGMWKTLLGIRNGTVNYENHRPHEGLSIEDVIRLTWQEKEEVPAVAAPRMGGPLACWASNLQSLQSILDDFGKVITDDELALIAHPHPISGPLSFAQRFHFLRFHIDRHRSQAERLRA